MVHANYPDVTLSKYLEESGARPADVYDGNRGWTDLCEAAGVPVAPAGPHEAPLRKALGRLLYVDDDERIAIYRRLLESSAPPVVASMPERERRLVRMLIASLGDQVLSSDQSRRTASICCGHTRKCAPNWLQLLVELDDRVDHLHGALPRIPMFRCKSTAATRASRSWQPSAWGHAKTPDWRAGVREAKDELADLLAFTSTRAVAAFRRPLDTATTPSAPGSFIGRANR